MNTGGPEHKANRRAATKAKAISHASAGRQDGEGRGISGRGIGNIPLPFISGHFARGAVGLGSGKPPGAIHRPAGTLGRPRPRTPHLRRDALAKCAQCHVVPSPGIPGRHHPSSAGSSAVMLLDTLEVFHGRCGGPRHERKAADHFSVDDIIVFAAGRVFALTPEDLGFISVKRLRLTVGSFVVALGCGLGCEWAERTDFTIEFRQPVKTGFRVG